MTINTSSRQDSQSLRDTASLAGTSQELVGVLQKIVRNAGDLLDVDNCSVALLDAGESVLVTLAALQKEGQQPRHTRFQSDEGVAGWVAQHREPLIINDVSLDARFKRLGRVPIGSMVCVPLFDKVEFIGTLTASSPQKAAFDERKLRMLTIFSEQAVLAFVNARQAEIARSQADQLRADQEQLRALWNASSDGIALLGPDTRFIEANPAFGQIFGIDPRHIVGMKCLEVFKCEDESGNESREGSASLMAIQRALQEGNALPYREIDLSIKGISHSIGLSITPVLQANRPARMMMARDMSAIRDLTRMKANFLSMITHELRSPINAINGYLDLTLTGIAGDLNEQQREFVRRARGGSEHLYALVEDLLLVSRADSGQLRLNRSVIALPELIRNSIEELELTAQDNDITIAASISGDFPRVYADGTRIQQVLRNLISNALRFTPPGGSVTISARVIEDATASEEETRKSFVVQVRDSGSGIAPEYSERIFERFYQIPLDHAGRTSGQGLGLAIVKMIVELHGGHVSVESTPGEGS
ncbi:MAG TPA: ATP-binding protein, partial [Ktedonobacteraceae bacterium]